MISNITFQGKYIQSGQVKRLCAPKTYAAQDVAFVELFPKHNIDDYCAIEYTAKQWEDLNYSTNIFNHANNFSSSLDDHYYIATSQNSDFEHINPEKILGITLFYTGNTLNSLDFLQVNPKYINKYETLLKRIFCRNKYPEYQYIGSMILNSLKSLYPDKTIELETDPDARGFYWKNGFSGYNFMRWNPPQEN